MTIPEAQLETWSHQGSIKQSRYKYKPIKNALDSPNAPYIGKNYNIFLQGSYGNDTNIYSESDVDIVIKLNDCFHHDLELLPIAQQNAFRTSHNDADYTHVNFKNDVISVLRSKFGTDINIGEKAVSISANGNRRKSDVIATVNFRRYYKFINVSEQNYDEGVCFYTSSNVKIINYPKQHSENMTKKHQDSRRLFKPMARIIKNIRSILVERKMLADGVAPSYYLEGMLYNVPNDQFFESYGDCFCSCINWLQKSDKDKLLCANEQYFLLRDNSPVTWRLSNYNDFIAAATKLWNDW